MARDNPAQSELRHSSLYKTTFELISPLQQIVFSIFLGFLRHLDAVAQGRLYFQFTLFPILPKITERAFSPATLRKSRTGVAIKRSVHRTY